MDGWMDGWVDGWMGGWMGTWTDGWMDGWMDEWMEDRWMGMGGWMDGWMEDGWMDGWMDGWRMGGWMGGWMDGWMDGGWVDGWMGRKAVKKKVIAGESLGSVKGRTRRLNSSLNYSGNGGNVSTQTRAEVELVHRMGVACKGSPGLAGIMDRGGDSVLTLGHREGIEKLLLVGGWGEGKGHTPEPRLCTRDFLFHTCSTNIRATLINHFSR